MLIMPFIMRHQSQATSKAVSTWEGDKPYNTPCRSECDLQSVPQCVLLSFHQSVLKSVPECVPKSVAKCVLKKIVFHNVF